MAGKDHKIEEDAEGCDHDEEVEQHERGEGVDRDQATAAATARQAAVDVAEEPEDEAQAAPGHVEREQRCEEFGRHALCSEAAGHVVVPIIRRLRMAARCDML